MPGDARISGATLLGRLPLPELSAVVDDFPPTDLQLDLGETGS
ncbi:hypothetical protein [Streptomyces sp. NPDC023588]